MVSERKIFQYGKLYIKSSLNPCCCGRWSQRLLDYIGKRVTLVLILVVVEDGLRVYFRLPYEERKDVLILVLVEDGLRVPTGRTINSLWECLNPCSYGRWSQRPFDGHECENCH